MPRPLRRWQLAQAAFLPTTDAPPSRVPLRGVPDGKTPFRYSPCAAALRSPEAAATVNEPPVKASANASTRTKGSGFGEVDMHESPCSMHRACESGRVRPQLAFGQQVPACCEAVQSHPRHSRSGSHPGERSVAHFIAVVSAKGSLDRNTGGHCAGVMVPASLRVKLLRIGVQTRGRILLGVCGNRNKGPRA